MSELKYGDPGYMEEDVSPRLYAITFSVLGAAIVVVSLRLFSRVYLLRARHLTASECLIIAAVVLDVASCGLIHGQIVTGMGRHVEYSRERPAMFVKSMQVGLAQNAVYQCLIGVIKTSILAQYCVLAVPGLQRRVVLSITGFVVLFTVFTTLSAIFQCVPVSGAWNLDTFPKGCWNMMGMNFFTSSMNTFLDFVIFTLPIPTIAKLHMEKKKKFTLSVGFGVGLFAIACSLVRLRNIVYFNGEGDFTFAASMVPIWGAIECNAGIVCASFPFTLPLFRWVSGSIIQSIGASRANASNGAGTHELQPSAGAGWPLGSNRRPSKWQPLSESQENIAPGSRNASSSTKDDYAATKVEFAPSVVMRETLPNGAV